MRKIFISFIIAIFCIPGQSQQITDKHFHPTPCAWEAYHHMAGILKSNRVKSREVYYRNSIDGRYNSGQTLVKREIYNQDGYLSEEIFYNSFKKTDSIRIYSYNEKNRLTKVETFDPLGELLYLVRLQYNAVDALENITFIDRNRNLAHLRQFQYQGGSVHQFEIEKGKTLAEKIIVREQSTDGCKTYQLQKTLLNTKGDTVNLWHTTFDQKQKTTVSFYPEKSIEETEWNATLQPLSIKIKDANNKVKQSVMFNYSDNGLVNGMAAYLGGFVAEEGKQGYNVLDDNRETRQSSLTQITQYSYSFY
jgi:hypothetical protein